MESISVGLDIGSSAVRAVEIEIKQGKRAIRRFAQVGIPNGFVVDGEIVNQVGVAEALRRLWAEGGFSTTKVVLGVSGPRVFVRQAEVAAMSREDLRSSLRFDAQEMVPLSLDEASFDFSVLSTGTAEPGSPAKMTVLLVAAHPDVLRTSLATLRSAGLSAVAMDSSALALVRAVPVAPPAEGSSGLDVVVSIGAELTTVAVRENGVPRFIRSLTVGGTKLTASVADTLHMEMAVAERLKRGAVPPDTPQLFQARKALNMDIRDLAEDVRATVDFFMAQSEGQTLDRLLITGGGSLTNGLGTAIGGDLPVEVFQVAPFAGFSMAGSGISDDMVERASASATTAVGLALWPFEAPLIRLSVLPEEVFKVQRARRQMQLAGVGVVCVAGILGAAGFARHAAVQSAQKSAHQAQAQATALQSKVTSLQAQTGVHHEMLARMGMVKSAVTGDLDYVRVIGQLADAMPANTYIGSIVLNRSSGSSGTSGVGSFSTQVTGTGDAHTASDWLRAMQHDPDFSSSWIGSVTITTTGNQVTVTFPANMNLT
ncbi:MAG TPA: type IV pilus assembly protein PilM, partial [Acidimicrobiales bacterium]|nr:type IV pilus assembly protein PilM [Acidimicrobiales bacterium]